MPTSFNQEKLAEEVDSFPLSLSVEAPYLQSLMPIFYFPHFFNHRLYNSECLFLFLCRFVRLHVCLSTAKSISIVQGKDVSFFISTTFLKEPNLLGWIYTYKFYEKKKLSWFQPSWKIHVTWGDHIKRKEKRTNQEKKRKLQYNEADHERFLSCSGSPINDYVTTKSFPKV